MTAAPTYQWQPSTAEIARRAGIPVNEVIRFDHNTSPRRPTWTADVASEAMAKVNEYPAADYTPLREAIAGYHGVTPEHVVPGAGADELILLAAKAFLASGERAVVDVPAYPMYRIATAQRGATLDAIDRGAELAYPTEGVVEAAQGAAVVWLCVPHNPIGDRPSDDVLEAVFEAGSRTMVVDAAYAEFAGDRWATWLERYPDLVVIGTMSKAFGLAGIRVGYALCAPERAAALHAVRPPGSVSTASAALAVRGFEDVNWMRENVRQLVEGRDALAHRLRGIGLEPRPSTTNFLLAPVADAHAVEQRLMARGIVVRKFPRGHALDDYLRFTVRNEEEHKRLITELEGALQ